jgi:hypothetical protein
MNKKTGYLLIAILISVSLSSCEIDTVPEPDGIISGRIRNALATNGEDDIFWSEQPNGFKITCTDLDWTESKMSGGVSFWGKADGSFYNCKLFAVKYSITPTNGAFHSAVAQEVKVESGKDIPLIFDVIPYCSLHDVLIEKDPDNPLAVKVSFSVTTNPVADDPATEEDETITATINNWRLFATSRTPYVGNNIYDPKVSIASDQPLKTEQLGQSIVYVKSGFQSGVKYYLRIGVRCSDSPEGRYNMSKIFEIEF